MEAFLGDINGPNYGFDFVVASAGPPRQGGTPPNYFDTTMPTTGRSFSLGSAIESVGGKRTRLEGDLESEFSWATKPIGKRARRDTYEDISGYTSALANEEPFSGVMSGDVARRFGFSMSMLSRARGTTIGFLTNPTIPGNETHLKKLSGYETPGEYDVIIIRIHQPHEPQVLKESAVDDFIVDATQYTAYTLSGFNRYLAGCCLRANWAPDPITYMRRVRDAEAGKNFSLFESGFWQKPETVWRYFHIAGVVNSETFADGTSSVTRHEYGMDHANRSRRNLRVNIIKLGRAFAVGLAPPNRPAGTNIGFLTKRVNRPELYRVDTTRDMTRDDETFMSLKTTHSNGPQLSKCPMQVIPWTSGRGKVRPSLEEREFLDDFGMVRHGHYKHFAVIHKENNTDPDVGHYELATDLALARTQTPLDIFISL